ncbi:hypothetical protein NPIL_261721, partial [Nephila pilipes]
LINIKDPLGRLTRWALHLQEMTSPFYSKIGKKLEESDSLSSSPLEDKY